MSDHLNNNIRRKKTSSKKKSKDIPKNKIRIKKQQTSGSKTNSFETNEYRKVLDGVERFRGTNRGMDTLRKRDTYNKYPELLDSDTVDYDENFYDEEDYYYDSEIYKRRSFLTGFLKRFVSIMLIIIIIGGSAGFIYVRGVISEMPVLTKKNMEESYINKDVVPLSKIPKNLQIAVISIEDQRFYKHKGIDIKSVLRSFVNNALGGNTQGGSTIEMQLSKNILTSNERTIKRKIQDMYNARMMNKIMTKDEILEAYLNNIYLGKSSYGVKAGAELYFGEKVEKLSFGQCTMLAGITNNPRLYQNYEQAKKRQALVLYKMYKLGYIKEHVYKAQLYRDTPFKSEIE